MSQLGFGPVDPSRIAKALEAGPPLDQAQVHAPAFLTNSFSLNMIANLSEVPGVIIEINRIGSDEAARLANGIPSAVGHEDTAKVFSAELGLEVKANRQNVALDLAHEQPTLLVGQYIGERLLPGAKTLPPGAQIVWMSVGIKAREETADLADTALKAIVNAFSLNMLKTPDGATVEVIPVSEKRAAELAVGVPSAVGLPQAAALLGNQLGREVPVNRQTIALSAGEAVLVGQYQGPRLAEGQTTLPDGAKVDWMLVRVK